MKPQTLILNGLLSCLFNHIGDARAMQHYIFSNITFKADIKAPLDVHCAECKWDAWLKSVFDSSNHLHKEREFWLFFHKVVCHERGMKDRKILQHIFEHKRSLVWWCCLMLYICNVLVPCFGPLAIQNVIFVTVVVQLIKKFVCYQRNVTFC